MPDPFESVSPLPADIRHVLIVMTAAGLTSLVAAGLLLSHITCKLVFWKIRDIRYQKEPLERPVEAPAQTSIDLNMGLSEDHYYQAKGRNHGDSREIGLQLAQQEIESVETMKSPEPEPESQRRPQSTRREKPPSPLLLLIYNLLMSDVVLSASYAHDAVWLAMDGIIAPSSNCAAQGWVVSFGCLTTSGFLFALSMFSYLGIIRGYKATTRDVFLACFIVWCLAIVLSSLGPMYFRDVTFYGRENTWCWISEKHKIWRLTVYVAGFLFMGATNCIYGFIFYRLWREGRSSRYMPRRHGSINTQISRISTGNINDNNNNNTNNTTNNNGKSSTALRPSGHHPAFLIYPCIYTITGTPLILGSLVPALERNARFMGAAGTLLALTGLLDSVLWSSIIVFSKKEDLANTGLDQFSFMRTPEGRTLGNIVFVQGGERGANTTSSERRPKRQSWHSRKDTGWWRLGDRNGSPPPLSRDWQPEYDGGSHGIQMEVVTSVVVEEESSMSHSRNLSRHRGMSLESSI